MEIRSTRRTLSGRTIAIAAASIALVFAAPIALFGHAVVFPKRSATGAYERYVLRVPNEKTVATTRVEIRFPIEARITGFEDVPGWQLEVLTDSAKRIIGAVWTGTLAPQRFVEFPFMVANPKTPMQLVWPAIQTYADSQRVEWTGAVGSKTPASTTDIGAGEATPTGGATTWVPWAALVVAILSLGLALRKPEPRPS